MLDELLERGCAYVHRFPPFYIASIGCHIFNLANAKELFYAEGGDRADARLHLIFCSPPGFSKTYWLNQFLREKLYGDQSAILAKSAIPVRMEATLTGAGFVGTTRFKDGDKSREMGLAEEHADAIIGIEEFSAVTSMFKQSYAGELDNALLLALDSGYVYKRLAAGPIEYQTFVTLQTGSQPARFDLSSGLGRRFLFLEFMPTTQDFRTLTLARRRSKGKLFNPIRTKLIKKELQDLRTKLHSLKEVVIDKEFYTFMDDAGIKHLEEVLHERFLIGLSVMRGNFTENSRPTLRATFDDVAKGLMQQEIVWRRNVKRGSEFSQVMIILEDFGGIATSDQVRERLLDYGMDFGQASDLIHNMATRLRLIIRKGGKLILPGYTVPKKVRKNEQK